MTETQHDLPDGSVCVVEVKAFHAMVSRVVEGDTVWAQSFTDADLVASVIASMKEHPENYTRRHLWDALGRAVR